MVLLSEGRCVAHCVGAGSMSKREQPVPKPVQKAKGPTAALYIAGIACHHCHQSPKVIHLERTHCTAMHCTLKQLLRGLKGACLDFWVLFMAAHCDVIGEIAYSCAPSSEVGCDGPHIKVIVHISLAKASVVAGDNLPEEGHLEHSDCCMQWGLAQPPVIICTTQTAHLVQC